MSARPAPRIRLACCGLVLTLLSASTAVLADTPFEQDGWTSWRVAANDHAPAWCCHEWNAGRSDRMACSLDDGLDHVSHSDDDVLPGNQIQLYARVENGKVSRLAALDPSCPVSHTAPLHDLGQVSPATSLAWLDRIDDQERRLDDRVLPAMAVHAGPEAARKLERIAQSDDRVERRKRAVFWMGQLRVEDTREVLRTLMRDDPDPRVREHAIFSWSQSDASDRTDVLIEMIEDQEQAFDDRKHALFWLAQEGDQAGVSYIQELLQP